MRARTSDNSGRAAGSERCAFAAPALSARAGIVNGCHRDCAARASTIPQLRRSSGAKRENVPELMPPSVEVGPVRRQST
jgi:hypothetical protein